MDRLKKRKKFHRKWILASGSVLVILVFSPVILRPGKIDPTFLSMPFTLWSGMLITVLMVVLTYLASRSQDDD